MWWHMNSQEEAFPLLECMCEYDDKLPAPKGFIWLLHCIRNSERIVKKEPLFLVPRLSLDEGHRALSPNGRYYYHSDFIASPDNPQDYTSTTLFWERGQPMPHKLPIPSLFYAVFSPDSRFLCGFTKDGAYRGGSDSFYVVECTTRKVRRLFHLRSLEDFTYKWGWYPDSRHIWYAFGEVFEEKKVTIYRCDISSGTQVLLQGREREVVFKDWDLLDPLYRYNSLTENARAFAYARNHQIRVRVEPIREWEEAKPGESEVYIERRNGQSRRLIRRGEHQWMRIQPLDVSEEGQWILLKCERMCKVQEANQTTESIRFELTVWHVPTKQHRVYARAEYPPVGMPTWWFARG
ncbi:hypothetical protein HRbin15_00442 [bacterium HR15]|uniref:Dipeptidylpeptidase IV N-terminal domain-containing protein n=1 Tax=uncultured prokaryote TaxID=198431 RepID=H5S9H9_9ZZZZ|nr:hypothetical protein HGMM_F03C06C20 [uncultured prokaryote]GBC91981.1 hypothetical protein HRbin15_00442 [bacterium HR15]